MKYLRQLLIIIGICFLGELISKALHLSIPGNVLGMLILLLGLGTKKIKLDQVEDCCNFLLDHLAFLFVPAAVGLMQCLDLIEKNLFPLVIIILVSTIVVFFVTGHTVQLLKGVKNERNVK